MLKITISLFVGVILNLHCVVDISGLCKIKMEKQGYKVIEIKQLHDMGIVIALIEPVKECEYILCVDCHDRNGRKREHQVMARASNLCGNLKSTLKLSEIDQNLINDIESRCEEF